MVDSPNFGMLGMLGNVVRRILGGGRSLKVESEERSESNGGGRETTTPKSNPRASHASIVSDSNNPPTPKSQATVDVAEVEGVEGVGGATRALTCARQVAANPPSGEARDSVVVVGLGLKLMQTVPVPRDSLVIRYHTKLGLKFLRRVVSKNQSCPSPAAITRARLALACTREGYNPVLYPNLVLQVRNTCILTAWEGMKFNGFSTFLYRLAEFHLVLHFVLRLQKARSDNKKHHSF
jgi:hypothetical protein